MNAPASGAAAVPAPRPSTQRLRRVLVANRGEIACRVVRSAHRMGLEAVAVHSEADRDALHVRMADAAVDVGPPPARDSYLAVDRLLAAARATGCDAVHPGYGFLSENAAFAAAVGDAGLAWIGPDPATIELMGDKDRARRAAHVAGVPVLPASPRIPAGEAGLAARFGAGVGFPLLVKATGGGGGIGMQRVDDPARLAEVVASTQKLAERAFGDGTVFLERYVPNARHVEVQVFGFGDGRAIHLGERECSIQRRFQKIIEESPSPALDAATRDGLARSAVRLAESVSYAGAGTVEFVYDDDTGAFWFLEMNTRIQVEHPVTEMRAGLDLVELQIRLAGGDVPALRQQDVVLRGHSIECRLYAENPAKRFFPSPGTVAEFVLPPEGEGLRIDTGLRAGDTITPFYDPLIAKLVSHGVTRDEAIGRMLSALARVRVSGVSTNLSFLSAALRHPAFRDGRTLTSFVDVHGPQLIGDTAAAGKTT